MSAAKLKAKIAPKNDDGSHARNSAAEIIEIPLSPAAADADKCLRKPGAMEIPSNVLADVEADAARSTKNDVATLINRLNADHFVSIEGGATSVYRETFDYELNRPRLDRISPQGFRTLHSHKIIAVIDAKGNSSNKQIASVWLNHPGRRTYTEGFSLLPGGKTPAGVYNLWRGFGCEPKRGATVADINPAREHLLNVVCSKDQAAFDYAMGWLARAVQYPDRQAEVAIVLHGGRGTGKGTLGRWFRDLFGVHGMHIQQPRHLTGNFNAHLRTCLALFVDESFFVGDKAGNSVLKSVITEDQITVEKKNVDAFTVRNRLKIIMATNEDHAILAGEDERRYLVLHVSDCKKQDHAYFGGLDRWWSNGGKESFLGYLLDYDLTNFDIRKVPNTGALERQKLASLPPLGSWLFERLQEGNLCPRHACGQLPIEWPLEQDRKNVTADYSEYLKNHGHRHAKSTPDAVGVGIRKFLELGDKRESTGERRRLWVFPSLADARKQFSKSLGLREFNWPDEDTGVSDE